MSADKKATNFLRVNHHLSVAAKHQRKNRYVSAVLIVRVTQCIIVISVAYSPVCTELLKSIMSLFH